MGGGVRGGPWVQLAHHRPHATAVPTTGVLELWLVTGGTSADACLRWRSSLGAPWVLTGTGRDPVSCLPGWLSLPPIPLLLPETGPSRLAPKGAALTLGTGQQGR